MRKFVQNTSLVLVSIVVGMAICEGVVRIISPQQLIIPSLGIWRPDSLFGHRHMECVNVIVNTGERPVHFVTDQYGYRINYCQRGFGSNNKTDFSILAIGDSFLEALAIENEQTIPEVIAKRLQSKYGVLVSAVNASVGAWNPCHYYLETKRSLSMRTFDIGIIFLYVSNDCVAEIDTTFNYEAVGVRHYFRFPKKISKQELVTSIFYPLNDFLETRSHLFIFLKRQFETTLSRIGLTAYYFPDVFLVEQRDSGRWEVVAHLCQMIRDQFSNYNIPVLFVILPAVYQVYEDIFYDYVKGFDIPIDSVDLEQPNKMLAACFHQHNLELIDPLYHMRDNAKKGLQMYGSIDRHLNAEGHRVIAEFLIPYIDEHFILTEVAAKLKEGD